MNLRYNSYLIFAIPTHKTTVFYFNFTSWGIQLCTSSMPPPHTIPSVFLYFLYFYPGLSVEINMTMIIIIKIAVNRVCHSGQCYHYDSSLQASNALKLSWTLFHNFSPQGSYHSKPTVIHPPTYGYGLYQTSIKFYILRTKNTWHDFFCFFFHLKACTILN